MKTLLVYHSRSGNTRRVAAALARRLHADVEQVVARTPRPGAVGYLRCAVEAIGRLPAPIEAPAHDPRDYDLIVVGTPVWFWSLSSPIRAWLQRLGRTRARFAFFCTMGGSGAQRVFDAMTALTGRAPAATLALTEGEARARRPAGLDAFVESLQRRAERHAPKRASARRRRTHAAATPA